MTIPGGGATASNPASWKTFRIFNLPVPSRKVRSSYE